MANAEQRNYDNKPVIERTDRLLGVGIDDNTYNFPLEDLIGFFNDNLNFNGQSGNISFRVIDYGQNVNSILSLINLGNPITIAANEIVFFSRQEPGRGIETFQFAGSPGSYGNGATQMTSSDLIQVFKQVISSDIDHDQTTNFVANKHVAPDNTSLVIEGNALVVKRVNGHTVETSVPAGAVFTDTQAQLSNDPTLNDGAIGASTVATNTLNTAITNHINNQTGNPHNVLASQISDFTTGVRDHSDVAANTTYRNVGHIPLDQKGANSGVAPLGADGLIPAQYLGSVIQANWDQQDTADPSFVRNKPSDVTNLSLHNTNELPEGPDNFYFTNARVTSNSTVVDNTNYRLVGHIPLSYLDTDVNLASNSDERVPSVRAAKTYIDGLIDGTLKATEAYNPTLTSAFPVTYAGEAIEKGDSFRIIASGTMNGIPVNAEDLLIAHIDAPGNDPANWVIAESNRDQATETILGLSRIATQTEANTGTTTLNTLPH